MTLNETKTEDLVERLRAMSGHGDPTIYNEAADRIEYLQTENDNLYAQWSKDSVEIATLLKVIKEIKGVNQ